jgi:hypothetical protein
VLGITLKGLNKTNGRSVMKLQDMLIELDYDVWELSDEDMKALEAMRLEGIKLAVRHEEIA